MKKCKWCGIELKPIAGLKRDREWCPFDARLHGIDIVERPQTEPPATTG